ncbi:phosphoribosylaminoimidazole carboxylase ade2 [Entomophthora muscae]|uniref:Phosphoribosylaminoimidazole carboxylase ade2 n=1 Tax=Entomophthora muscae TaxID=34485 RepID=A0ACC2SN60_9FUNG|nr:phosphoribosylaminoimidazole carboxylase ade2 [Entomophthora muscae]
MDSKIVGVLGGGQLGRMMVEAGHRLGMPIVILDEAPNGPAKQLSGCIAHIDGAFKDSAKIKELKSRVDVLTVEIEHIDVKALYELDKEAPGSIQPTPHTLELIQDKYRQKVHLASYNLPISEFKQVSNVASLAKAGGEWGYPLMLKAKALAYDGRGNFVISDEKSAHDAASMFAANPLGFYVERWVKYTKELACMVVRSIEGEVVSYPVVETVQKDNVCHVVLAPACVSGSILESAKRVAESAIATFSGAGIFGVEMFLTEAGDIFINEIAPRPHNSGHYTMEACHTSQFENHLRAVSGLPLGSGALKVPCAAMVNILGASDSITDLQATMHESLKVSGATVHWYGKRESRNGRKMGHVTIVADDVAQLQDRLALVLAALPGGHADEARWLLVQPPSVGVIMGSDSDLPKMKDAARILEQFGVPFELTIVSAHRTPDRMVDYARAAHQRGIKVIIAAAGGAAHLPGMVASMTPLPVIGVPISGKHLDGVDSLHSIVQMPRGVPVATVAIDNSTNAALLAIRILGPPFLEKMMQYQQDMKHQVLEKAHVLESTGWKD